MPADGVNLKFRDQRPQPDTCIRRSWAGFSVECVRIRQARAFEYDWEGPRHYLAVHDILLRDGEVKVGGRRACEVWALKRPDLTPLQFGAFALTEPTPAFSLLVEALRYRAA
jgi:hypothetical protein